MIRICAPLHSVTGRAKYVRNASYRTVIVDALFYSGILLLTVNIFLKQLSSLSGG